MRLFGSAPTETSLVEKLPYRLVGIGRHPEHRQTFLRHHHESIGVMGPPAIYLGVASRRIVELGEVVKTQELPLNILPILILVHALLGFPELESAPVRILGCATL